MLKKFNQLYRNIINESRGLDNEYMNAVEMGDAQTAQKIINHVAEQSGYTVLYHVGDMKTPRIKYEHEIQTGGAGELYLTSDPGAWVDTLEREEDNISRWAIPRDMIATRSPNRKELIDWAIEEGYMKMDTVRKPGGEIVYELDNKTPLVRPTETERGKALPFYNVKDPMRGGGELQKHLNYAYLKEAGYIAYQSEYSPEGHEIAVFDLTYIESAEAVVKNRRGDIILPSQRFK